MDFTIDIKEINDPDVWDDLFEVIKKESLRRAEFNELLRFCDPPPVIKSSYFIFRNLDLVFDKLISVLNTSKYSTELGKLVPTWQRCCRIIVARSDEIRSNLPDMFATGSQVYIPPFHGHYETHPLGVALWCSPSTPAELDQYRLLQAYLCLSVYMLRVLEKGNPNLYDNAKIVACRAIRKLAHPENVGTLSLLPATAISLEEYYHLFMTAVKDEDFHPVTVLFEFALMLQRSKAKGKGSRKLKRNRNPYQIPKQIVEFGDVDQTESENVYVITRTTGNSAEQTARKKNLCAPTEFDSAKEFLYCPQSGPDPSGGLSFGQQHIKAKIASSAIALHNQHLTTDWDQLTSYEVNVFLKELKSLSSSDQDICGINAKELAAFLTIVFWTSASSKVAAETVRVRAAAACKVALGICWDDDLNAEWVIKPFVPRLKLVKKSILVRQTLPLAERFTLAMPEEAAVIIGNQLNRIPSSYRPVVIFRNKAVDLEHAAEHFLHNLRHRHGGRQSLQRLSGCLHGVLARMPGSDITAAMSITGKNDPLGVVPVHYTANGIARLRELYRRACRELLNRENGSEVTTVDQPVSNTPATQYYVGSRFVPREEVVTRLVLDLRDRLKVAREIYRDCGDPVQLHNDLTVYTTMMLGFATGYRAVRDPLLQDAEIDRTTGFGLISDKDGDDYYNTRIIWLPEICLRQLDNYLRHVKELQSWLFEQNQDLFFKVRHQAITGRHGERVYPALFLLQRNAEGLMVQPKRLQELLITLDYQLPMNANRHYLRTWLIADNCPVEIVNAFLGHWERGQEPWGCYSGLSPAVYREQLATHLIPLLKSNGWTPEEGLG